MNDTSSDDGKRIIKNRASRYISENGVVCNAPAINNPVTLVGNGDLYSTLNDMQKWDEAFRTEKSLLRRVLKLSLLLMFLREIQLCVLMVMDGL